jgi:ABC-type iron transport system FetAB permease component
VEELKKESKWLSGGAIGAILGLIIIRSLLEYIRKNNLPESYRISIYVLVVIISLIGAMRLGKKSKKLKNSILLSISIISFVFLYTLGKFIRNSYPGYDHIVRIPIIIGMIIAFVSGIFILFSFGNQS